MTIGTVYSAHEALAAFAGEEALLQRGKFYRYVTMEGLNTVPGVRVLLALQDGRPLLVDKDLGRGRVLFFAASADRDWTDLPTRTAYVPLIHGLVGYAAHLSAASQRSGAIMPESARLLGREEDDGATVTINTPDGQERLTRYTHDGTLTVAPYTSYTVPGIYRLATPAGTDLLAVNGTRAESNFEKIQAADLQTRLRPLSVVVEEEETFGQAVAGSVLPTRQLASLVLLTLVVVLAVENVCANRL